MKPLYTKTGLLICTDFIRIEKGGRGDYYEISPFSICINNLYIPKSKVWKINNKKVDYIEYRTKDKLKIKIYYQTNLQYVDYANYRIGYFYVSTRNVLRKKPINLLSFVKGENFVKNN